MHETEVSIDKLSLMNLIQGVLLKIRATINRVDRNLFPKTLSISADSTIRTSNLPKSLPVPHSLRPNGDTFRERSRSQSDADCRFLLNDRSLQADELFCRKSSIQSSIDSQPEVVFERDSKFKTQSFSYIFPNPEVHCNLSVGSAAELDDNRFLRTLSDADSVVANCASDVSDISSEDCESDRDSIHISNVNEGI
ncbi:hypothetical protein CEXT_559551 [Caerostris extrusa]|uniref:Uncharacterized protein n=1 Tax=Caerostris extrusa TaxID=172846 RepID=A0AAV4STH0_CAEEX|nr:hypothetical protein CEXT_559551 [Caerostris extrusa]